MMKRTMFLFVLGWISHGVAFGQAGASARNPAGTSPRASENSPFVEIPPDIAPENYFALIYNAGTPREGEPGWYDVKEGDGFAKDFKREFKVSFEGVSMSFPVAFPLGRKKEESPFPAPEFTVTGATAVDSLRGEAPTLPYQGFYLSPRITDASTVNILDKLKSYEVHPASNGNPAVMAHRWSLGWVGKVAPVAITSSLLFKLPEGAASADTEYGLIVPVSEGGGYLSSINPETNKPIYNQQLRAVYLHKPENLKVKLWWEPADAVRVWHTPFKARTNGEEYFENGEITSGTEFVHKSDTNPVFVEMIKPVKAKLMWGIGDVYHAIELVPCDMVPDWNRDGVIDNKDRGKVTAEKPWRWWINDDADSGDIADDGTDQPMAGEPFSNYYTEYVNGRCDLLDFAPLWLNIKQILDVLPPGTFTYKFKQEDGAVNIVLTDLVKADAGRYLKQDYTTGFGSTFADPPQSVDSIRITAAGVQIPVAFLGSSGI